MHPSSPVIERDLALEDLVPGREYVALFMALGRLLYLAEEAPEVFGRPVLDALDGVLSRAEHADKKTAYFLYRKAAGALAMVLAHSPNPAARESALSVLSRALCQSSGPVHRAVAESLSRLPLSIPTPKPDLGATSRPARTDLCALMALAGAEPSKARVLGRSVVAPALSGSRVLVVKLARAGEDPGGLAAETAWMDFLRQDPGAYGEDFYVPRSLSRGESRLFSFSGLSVPGLDPDALHPDRLGVAFLARPEYFRYPNEPGNPLPAEDFLAVLAKNARILGAMSAAGVLHTAPIPLFHNRVQQRRRDDRGLYHWPRSGRLDQWLASCFHPNVGDTGPRDFEHLVPYSGFLRDLYLHMGTQVLSLALVAGSWFRAADPGRAGLDEAGNPVDARDLFDEALFARMLQEILAGFCLGFSGKKPPELGVDYHSLARAMIGKMGVDADMEEMLRVHDQRHMSRQEFDEFLSSRGWSKER
ncbi:MAG: SidJ-related pseudokinase, partial [Deltaproteobacteria bacterium]|nr:SidJ-related pseudokinase [Deltaproteobacteria bacterium]